MIETDNIYYAAYLFNEGMNFCGAKPYTPGSKKIIFSFESPDPIYAKELEALYKNQEAMTNIRKYLDALVLMRDILHKTTQQQRSITHKQERLIGKDHGQSQEFRITTG